MKHNTLALLTLVSAMVLCSPASARSERELGYQYNRVWTAAVRFLRVDMNYPVTEKDKDAGYIMFEYKDAGRSRSGSMELIEITKSGRKMVRVRVQIPEMPSYIGSVFMDKFKRKLDREYGVAPNIMDESISSSNAAKPTADKKSSNSSQNNGDKGGKDDTANKETEE